MGDLPLVQHDVPLLLVYSTLKLTQSGVSVHLVVCLGFVGFFVCVMELQRGQRCAAVCPLALILYNFIAKLLSYSKTWYNTCTQIQTSAQILSTLRWS